MKRMRLIIATLVAAVTLSGCGLPFVHTQSEQDQAADVVRKWLEAYHSVTYKDPKSFTAKDQYLIPSLAAKADANIDNDIKIFTDNKGYQTHGPGTVTFIKQDGNSYVFDGKITWSLNSETKGKNLFTRTFDGVFTVAKQPDGKFLITGIYDPSNYPKN